jgi:hypothetical protein
MKSAIREYDPIRITVPIDALEDGTSNNILHFPIGSMGTALEDYGDAFECTLALPDPEAKETDIVTDRFATTSVRLDQMERA